MIARPSSARHHVFDPVATRSTPRSQRASLRRSPSRGSPVSAAADSCWSATTRDPPARLLRRRPRPWAARGALSPHFDPVTVDFSGALQVFHAGYGSVAVPGVLNGYLEAHRRLGRLPLSEVVAPAVALARSRGGAGPSQAGRARSAARHPRADSRGRSASFSPTGGPQSLARCCATASYARFLELVGRRRTDGPGPTCRRAPS